MNNHLMHVFKTSVHVQQLTIVHTHTHAHTRTHNNDFIGRYMKDHQPTTSPNDDHFQYFLHLCYAYSILISIRRQS